jgi:hypothetical protein
MMHEDGILMCRWLLRATAEIAEAKLTYGLVSFVNGVWV